MSTSTDLVIPNAAVRVPPEDQLWPEALDTPGLVPRHLKRTATRSFPLLEVLQRLLYRFRPSGTAGDLEKVLAIIGLYQTVRPVYNYLRDFFLWSCTSQVTVPESDPVAKNVLAWMGAEVILNSRTRSAMMISGGLENLNNGFPNPMRFPGPAGPEHTDDEVVCLPPLGTRIFWVGFRPFLFSRTGGQSYHRNNSVMAGNLVNDHGQLQNALTITTLGWSLAPLRKFAELCHEFKIKNLNGTTTVYFAGGRSDPYGDGWQSVSKAIRKLDTIDMDEEVKSDIIRDAEYYYSEQSRQFFADCGIPYRRGYLFHGPPGTGKSSFSAALAGHLQCDIYHINLASGDISDGSLHRLFLSLPRKCVVVIEDIDSAGIGREHLASKPKPPETEASITEKGRLLIMTSNNPDALDPALTRPGRIDKKVYFGNMSRTAGKSIFRRLIGRSALAHDAAFTMAEIEQYAIEFAEKVPANTFTPAQVQNFLQGCRSDPHTALRDIDAWVTGNRDTLDEQNKTSKSSDTSASLVEHAEVEDGSDADSY
ncbi:P-loop containing nucleoside triphosphate hydrolase protein [Setomelanomma holmii]|uniref:P-loop containing nucleoside triphosphate hydrolase protein n=1 Tax=Setomelanomma holmii TaxID=210430 RepID=A0A9P4LKN6_9PLEO|nr:P-loop containing nucleoside triphosphate hydrolase protein [Setomelanomma holmii]